MRRITSEEQENIKGGSTTISSAVINAFVNVIKVLKDAGYSLGSGIRRISENKICPLD